CNVRMTRALFHVDIALRVALSLRCLFAMRRAMARGRGYFCEIANLSFNEAVRVVARGYCFVDESLE
ncbi:MAG: hypothetical protein WA723_18090, partial [Pseudolabrys sp.]